MNIFRRIFQFKLRFLELKAIFQLFVGRITSFSPKEKKLWLISERGTDARDNGYWLFCYIKNNHPEVNVKYIISRESEDRKKLLAWENDLVDYESFKHFQLLWLAEKLISTHIAGYCPKYIRDVPTLRRFFGKLSKAKAVSIHHGIVTNDVQGTHYGKVFLDLNTCGAKPEYDFVSKYHGFPEGIVQYLGLARFDQLHNISCDKTKLLLMPTWRMWLKDEDVTSSEYIKEYINLLQSSQLHILLKKNKLHLVFYPHYEIQPYISEFTKLDLPENIIIADKAHYDVQQLLKESALLITDYSSVFFDFAYMKKPILYFQFDEKRFREDHYAKGYYDYHDGLGEWTDNIDDLLDAIEKLAHDEFKMPEKYKNKVNEFFPLNDTNNCERIYKAICNLN